MADLTTELRTYLLSKTAISTLVGSGVNGRIYFDFGRQNSARPFVIIEEFGGSPSPTLAGTAGLAQSTMRIISYDATGSGAATLWETIRVNLDRQSGTWGTVEVGEVAHALLGWRDSGVILPQDRSEDKLYWVSSVYNIWHDVTAI